MSAQPKSGRYPRRAALAALHGAAMALAHPAAADTPPRPPVLQPETLSVVELKDRMQPHWVWINDISFNHMSDGRAYLVDADAGTMLGMISAGNGHGVVQILPDGKTVAVPATFYSRGMRGKREDVITFYAIHDLAPGAEVSIPPKRIQTIPFPDAEPLTDDGRFSLIYNFTPEQTISVVDIPARKFVGEFATPGCGAMHMTGPRQFMMQCADGSLQLGQMSEDGQITLGATSATLFRPEDPASERPVRIAPARYLFFTYAGEAVEAGVKADRPALIARWPLQGADGAGWRPGGTQPMAYHTASGRLYVLMHKGGPNTQKEPGSEIWVYDVAKRTRLARLPLDHPASSVAISADAAPLLYTALFGSGMLDVRDPASGRVIRKITGIGSDLTVIQPSPLAEATP